VNATATLFAAVTASTTNLSALNASTTNLSSTGFTGVNGIFTSSLAITGTTTVRNIIPETTNTYSIGASSSRFLEGWIATLNLGTSTWSIGQSSSTHSFSIFDAPSLTGNQRFTIDTTGNVGIGTSSPSSKLSVYGDALLEGSNRYLNFGSTTGSSGYGIRDNAGTLEFKNSGGSWNAVSMATSGPSFYAHKAGSGQSLPNTTETLVTFSSSTINVNNNFSTTTGRFTPTVPGKYLLVAAVASDSFSASDFLNLIIKKNGNSIALHAEHISGSATFSNLITFIVDANGTGDYFEIYAYQGSGSSKTISGSDGLTYFSGALLAPLNPVAGGWSNDNTQSYLTDTTDNVVIGTTTAFAKLSVQGNYGSTLKLFDIASTTSSTGATSSLFTVLSTGNIGIGTSTPLSKLTVYGDALLEGSSRYLNFGTTTGSSGYGIRDNAGTLEFKNSGGSWTGIGTGGGGVGSVPAFKVNKGGSNQTIAANTPTRLTWSTEEFDTNNNFVPCTTNCNSGSQSASESRFTPTVAGKYQFNANVYSPNSPGDSYSIVYLVKNSGQSGSATTSAFQRTTQDKAVSVSTIFDMNGTTDYVEVFFYSGDTTVSGDQAGTTFSGSLISSTHTNSYTITPSCSHSHRYAPAYVH
jgi:hypothetical protein